MSTVGVKLKKKLEHGGREYPPGTPMTMDRSRAERLAHDGVVEIVSQPIPALLKAPETVPEVRTQNPVPQVRRKGCCGFRW